MTESDLLPLSHIQKNRLGRELTGRGTIFPMTEFLDVEIVFLGISIDDVTHSLHAVFSRHDALRTSIVSDQSGGMIQHVADAVLAAQIVVRSWTDDTERLLELSAWLADTIDGADTVPLARARVDVVDDRVHVALKAEHLICDGASIQIVASEVASTALKSGRHDIAEQPHPLQYSEWSSRELARLSGGDDRQRDLDYWREHLGPQGAFPLMDVIPFVERTGDVAPSFVEFTIDNEHWKVISSFEDGIHTPTSLSVSALSQAIARTTADESVVLHTPVSNRTSRGSSRVVGWLAHSIPVRLTPDRSSTAVEHIHSARSQFLECLKHQSIPLHMITRELYPDQQSVTRGYRLPRVYLDVFDPERTWANGAASATLKADRWPPIHDESGISCHSQVTRDGYTTRIVFVPQEVDSTAVQAIADSMERFYLDLAAECLEAQA